MASQTSPLWGRTVFCSVWSRVTKSEKNTVLRFGKLLQLKRSYIGNSTLFSYRLFPFCLSPFPFFCFCCWSCCCCFHCFTLNLDVFFRCARTFSLRGSYATELNFSGVELLRTVSKIRKTLKWKMGLSCLRPPKNKIRKFHVVVVRWQQEMYRKVWCLHVQICCFAHQTFKLFQRFRCCSLRSCFKSL